MPAMSNPPAISRGQPLNPWKAQKLLLDRMGVASPVIFDVGGHHGETIGDYRRLWPDARIVSFEPDPANFESLRKAHGDDTRTTLIKAAVADRAGTTVFHLNHHDATHSLLPRATASRRYYPTWAGSRDRVEVATTTLDDAATSLDIEQLHILKLDIQGGERLALAGAHRTLRERGVMLVHTEAFFVPHYDDAPLLHDVWRCLASFGFTLFDLHNFHHARNGQLRFCEALFVSDTVRERAIDPFDLED